MFKAQAYVASPITKLLLFVLESIPKTKEELISETLRHYPGHNEPDEILGFDLTEKTVPDIASLPKTFVVYAESVFSLKSIGSRSPEISLCFYFDGPVVGHEIDATSNLIKPKGDETSFKTIRPLSHLHKGIGNIFIELAKEAELVETKANLLSQENFVPQIHITLTHMNAALQ